MKPETMRKCALAATIALAPGGFVLGAGLLAKWLHDRHRRKAASEGDVGKEERE